MGDALEAAFVEEVGVSPAVAAFLAGLVRSGFASMGETSEESSEDLVLRMRDPRVFGTFAASALSGDRATSATKSLLAEHAFDLLPLPRGEADVILVESRAPPRLLDLAAFLAAEDRLTVLHVMHLVYAAFLDRALVTNVTRPVRRAVLESVLALEETPEPVRILYACLHLASVREPEAHATLRRILRGPSPESLRRSIAAIAASEDGGVRILADLAQAEGLLPTDPSASSPGPTTLANIPRLPERLGALGRRWLAGS